MTKFEFIGKNSESVRNILNSVKKNMEELHDSDLNIHIDDEGLADAREARKQSILRYTQSLVHAGECFDPNCLFPSCQKLKRVVQHTKNCKRGNVGCSICKQIIALCCYHAKHCPDSQENCLVPFCPKIKDISKQQQLQQHR